MARHNLSPPGILSQDISSTSTMVPTARNSSISVSGSRSIARQSQDANTSEIEVIQDHSAGFEKDFQNTSSETYASMEPRAKTTTMDKLRKWFALDGNLRPFRLLKQDVRNIRIRYVSDWTTFNQLVFASAVYVFFTNILPGITFASDLYVLTGKTWGTIEVVFSTGLCGLIFSL